MSKYTFKDFYEFKQDNTPAIFTNPLNLKKVWRRIGSLIVLLIVLITGFIALSIGVYKINKYDIVKTNIKVQETISIWKSK
jgi:hypothetical protein